MALNITGVHVMERREGRDFLVKSLPYTRFVDSGYGAVSCQGGRFYSDGGNQPAIPREEVADWVWRAARAMTVEGRENVGLILPEEQIQDEESVEEEDDSSESAQSLGDEGEAEKSLVDFVYELRSDMDAHWTKTGLPDLNALREFVGSRVSREEVESACPGYRRPEES